MLKILKIAISQRRRTQDNFSFQEQEHFFQRRINYFSPQKFSKQSEEKAVAVISNNKWIHIFPGRRRTQDFSLREQELFTCFRGR